MIAAGGDLWSMPDGEYISSFSGGRYIMFSPDGSMIASGSDDETVKLRRVSDGECISTPEGHGGPIGSVAFSSDDSLIASGGDDGSISLWSVSDGELISLYHFKNLVAY